MKRKPVKPKSVASEAVKTAMPSDCLQCLHGRPWKYGLTDCEKAVTAVANCKDRNIACVNYKPKEKCTTRQS